MVPLQLWKLLNSLMHMFLHVLDAWRLNWALITSWMVPLLFYSGHLACMFSNKNSTFQFVWRENCFSLCLSPFLIEFGFWSSSFMFTYKVFFHERPLTLYSWMTHQTENTYNDFWQCFWSQLVISITESYMILMQSCLLLFQLISFSS